MKKNKSQKVFNNYKINLSLLLFKAIFIFNFMGIIVFLLNRKQISYIEIVIFTLIALLFSTLIYLTHITKLEFIDSDLVVHYNHKIYRKPLVNFIVTEKSKVRGINIRFERLIIKDFKFNKKFKIDSSEWMEYKDIRDYFLKNKILKD